MNWKGKVLSIAGAAVLGLGISGGALAVDDKDVTVAVTQSAAGVFTYAFVNTTVAQALSSAEITGLVGATATGSVGLEVTDTRVAENRGEFDLQIVSTDFTGQTTPADIIDNTAFDLTNVTGTTATGVTIVATSGGLDAAFSIIDGADPHDAFATTIFTLGLSLAVPADIPLQTYEATLTVSNTLGP